MFHACRCIHHTTLYSQCVCTVTCKCLSLDPLSIDAHTSHSLCLMLLLLESVISDEDCKHEDSRVCVLLLFVHAMMLASPLLVREKGKIMITGPRKQEEQKEKERRKKAKVISERSEVGYFPHRRERRASDGG